MCSKLKKMVTEMKEILDTVYNESTLARVYHCYNEFKSGRKSAELMGGSDTPTTALTKQSTLAQR